MTGIRNTGRGKSRRGELDVGKVSEKCRKNVGKEQNDLKDDPIDDLKELTERQKIILELITVDPTISAKAVSEKISERISEKIDVTDRTIENDLAQLKKMGILVREGGRKGGRWIIKTRSEKE